MRQKESRPARDGSEQKPIQPYYRSRDLDATRILFHHFKTFVRHRRGVIYVILYVRVSSKKQARNGNLRDQINKLRADIADIARRFRVRIRVLKVYRDDRPGWIMGLPGRTKALNRARRTGAIVLAESVDRFIRPMRYSSKDESTWTRRPDYEKFQRIAHHVTCATMELPSNDDGRQRSAHIKRGQEQKNRKGGRPKKLVKMTPSQRKPLLMPEIRRLRAQTGSNGKPMGCCKIAETIKANWTLPCKAQLSPNTVLHWLKRYGEQAI